MEYSHHGQKRQTYGDLIANKNPTWLFLEFAPQGAILDQQADPLFLTHAGAPSANEALYHGLPMLARAICGNQLQNSMRLVAAGVAMSLSKEDLSLDGLCTMIGVILQDRQGEFRRNVPYAMCSARCLSEKAFSRQCG